MDQDTTSPTPVADPDANQPITGSRPSIASKFAIVLFYLLGIFFAVSAITKALAYQDFIKGIRLYHVVTEPAWVKAAAVGTLSIETFLAAALAFRFSPRRITIPTGLILLTVFTGLIAYAWKYHNLEDCGCFGEYLTMGPLASIIKNGVLISLLGWLWFMSESKTVPHMSMSRLRNTSIAFLLLGALNIGLAKTHKPSQNFAAAIADEDDDQDRGPFGYVVTTEDGEEFDLEVGDYLVALLSTTCEHCMAAVPKLNQMIAEVEGFPQIIALCLGDDQTLEAFRQETLPEFPTQLIPDLEFFNLIEQKPPRFVALRDGQVLKAWEAEDPPNGYEIIEALWDTAPSN